jgi:hypothetical protein
MLTMKQVLARAAFAGASMLGAASANAGDVFWSIGIEAPIDPYGGSIGATISNAHPRPVYRPAPVYVQPAPIYYAPAPVYYHRPAPIIVRPGPIHHVHRPPVWSHSRHPHWRGHDSGWRDRNDWRGHDRGWRDRNDWRGHDRAWSDRNDWRGHDRRGHDRRGRG